MEERWSGEKIFGLSGKSFQKNHWNCKFFITCELWIGGFNHAPVFSRVDWEEIVTRRF